MPLLPCGYCTNGRVTFRTSIADAKCFRCDGKGTRFISQGDLDAQNEAEAAEQARKAALEAARSTPAQWDRIRKAAQILGTSESRIFNRGNGHPGDWSVTPEETTREQVDAAIAFAITVYRAKPAQRKRMLFPNLQQVAA